MRHHPEQDAFESLVRLARKTLSPRRYLHSLGFCHTAIGLARQWGAGIYGAAVAGILHDITKELSPHEIKADLQRRGIGIAVEDEPFHRVWHGLAAAAWAEQDFGIDDPSILEAIRYHATAEAGVSLLTRISFVADMTEPTRDYKGVEELRDLSARDFDGAFVKTLAMKIEHLKENKRLVHPRALRALAAFSPNEPILVKEEA